MSKLIVVIGITGAQGGSVGATFSKLPGWRVRGVTRDTSKPAARELAAQGIEMVQADIADAESLVAAFHGAHTVFAVTDFWAPLQNPATLEKAAAAEKTINLYAYELEIQYGKNIANAAAETEGLERFIYSALSDGSKWSKGKYTWAYHFESKAKVVEYVREELPELDAKMSTVHIGFYTTNWKKLALMQPVKQADGTYVVKGMSSGDHAIPFIVAEKDTGAFVKALIESPPGIEVLGYTRRMSWDDYMDLWSKTLGVRGRYQQMPQEEFLAAVPEPVKRQYDEVFRYIAEFGWAGGDPKVVHPEDLPVKAETSTIEEYFRNEDWSTVL